MFGFWPQNNQELPQPNSEKPAISLEVSISKELLIKILTLLVGAGFLGSSFLSSNIINPANSDKPETINQTSEKVLKSDR